MKENSTILILLASGIGSRFQSTTPKQYHLINDKFVIRTTIDNLISIASIDYILPVINPNHVELYHGATNDLNNSKLLDHIYGGKTRAESVLIALQFLKSINPQRVLIHDSVRINPNENIINNILQEISPNTGAIPTIAVVDSIIKSHNSFVSSHIDRENIHLVQTPQGFPYGEILNAYENTINKIDTRNFSDDSSYFLYNCDKNKVKIIEGDLLNYKITQEQDLKIMAKIMQNKKIKVGQGVDVHEFSTSQNDNKDVILGGIKIPYHKGLKGHSDADVVLHALVDAIFGVLNCGDIGDYFPPQDDKYKGMASSVFLEFAKNKLKEQNAIIMNIDITILAQEPKISPYKLQMQQNIGRILQISPNDINIKATTTEHLGFVGRKEGILALATICVSI